MCETQVVIPLHEVKPAFVHNFVIPEELLTKLTEDANGRPGIRKTLRRLIFLDHTRNEIVSSTHYLLTKALLLLVSEDQRYKRSLGDFQMDLESSLLVVRERAAFDSVTSSEPQARFSSGSLYPLAVFFSTWVTSNEYDLMLQNGCLACEHTVVRYNPFNI